MNKNMTALVSAFARYYHTKNSNIKIYNDKYIESILTEDEINNISSSMISGINYFNSNFKGNDPLKYIVNTFLSPQVLARSAFNMKHLLNEINLGCEQYVVIASGYDTSMYMVNKKVNVYELDKDEMIKDKESRVKNAKIDNSNVTYIGCDFNDKWIDKLLKSGFDKNKKTFVSMLGISYYLDKTTFLNTIKELSCNMKEYSAFVFDYKNDIISSADIKIKQMADSLDEKMKSSYSKEDIMALAESTNTLVYEDLNYMDINKYYFYNYNTLNPDNKINAPIGVSYCLLVKKG